MAATAKLSDSIETRLFINNEFRESSNNKTFEVIYPYTKEVLQMVLSSFSICKPSLITEKVQEADVKDVNGAVSAAQAAFAAWRDLGVEQRGNYLHKVSELIPRMQQ